ncbi:hypothetical protein HO133_007679 [Letharia lupina]|uniref:Uncharacterized protein n=1 Tax=Letharia lupina TaxID=560253 RepID=A0A8H6CRF2_9LECA|nr:uncharacterized protein HO133_007679 [Letharia lupina]KAF6227951.1 hypothetical protein HO133_007679 [Letharia lupina]
MIADLQRQLVAANERFQELEEMNELLEEELESLRRHVAEVDGYQLEDYASTTSSLAQWADEFDSEFPLPCRSPNGVEDFRGYMPLIEPHGAEKWWSPESLREMNFKEDENPYDVPDDHPAAKLQITTKAVKEWIFALRVDPVTKGVRLAKMWKRILLRRIFSGQVPFNDGRKISDQLPRVQGALINCTHTPTE